MGAGETWSADRGRGGECMMLGRVCVKGKCVGNMRGWGDVLILIRESAGTRTQRRTQAAPHALHVERRVCRMNLGTRAQQYHYRCHRHRRPGAGRALEPQTSCRALGSTAGPRRPRFSERPQPCANVRAREVRCVHQKYERTTR